MKGKTILIVHSRCADLTGITEVLAKAGARVLIAEKGEEGVLQIQRTRPHLVLVDADLPGMDGFQVCRTLKACANTRDIPVIFIIVYLDNRVRQATFAAGASDYLQQPLQVVEVMARLRTHLALSELRRQVEYQDYTLRFTLSMLEKRVAARTGDIAQSNQQLSELSLYHQRMREEECARISRELHDELGSYLTAMKMDVDWMRSKNQGAMDPPTAQRVESLGKLVEDATTAMRRIVLDLRPPMLDDLGLSAAVEWLVDQFKENTGVECDFQFHLQDFDVSRNQGTVVYRMIQESLTNVARHANASHVSVRVEPWTEGGIRAEVADNGRGLNVTRGTDRPTFGLLGMHERAAGLGGWFQAREHDGGGTLAEVVLPTNVNTEQGP